MATQTARWTRLDHDQRRAQILAAARRLFSDDNYAAVSSAAIAREAGVARGLLHHYFGTKRELYLEVVRSVVRVVPLSDTGPPAGPGLEAAVDEVVNQWLDRVHRNRVTWLASIDAEGLGSDPEVERIVEEARENMVDRLIAVLGLGEAEPQRELRAVLHAYGGLAEAASRQWLRRRRLSRSQVHTLLSSSLLHIVREVWPQLRQAHVDAAKTTATRRR